MNKGTVFNKVLAGVGTVFVWLPLLAPAVFSIISLMSDGIFRFDYLMPFELFPLILLGSGLLIWASIRARSRLKLIGWSLGAAIGLVVISQVVAMVSGLASGRIEPTGVWWAIVLIFMAGAVVGIIAIGVGGILLLRDLFHKS
jgi:hypothetical protein